MKTMITWHKILSLSNINTVNKRTRDTQSQKQCSMAMDTVDYFRPYRLI